MRNEITIDKAESLNPSTITSTDFVNDNARYVYKYIWWIYVSISCVLLVVRQVVTHKKQRMYYKTHVIIFTFI